MTLQKYGQSFNLSSFWDKQPTFVTNGYIRTWIQAATEHDVLLERFHKTKKSARLSNRQQKKSAEALFG